MVIERDSGLRWAFSGKAFVHVREGMGLLGLIGSDRVWAPGETDGPVQTTLKTMEKGETFLKIKS